MSAIFWSLTNDSLWQERAGLKWYEMKLDIFLREKEKPGPFCSDLTAASWGGDSSVLLVTVSKSFCHGNGLLPVFFCALRACMILPRFP